MKTNLLLSSLAIILLTGCAGLTTDQKAARVYTLTKSAAKIGTQITLNEKPDTRPQFELAYVNLVKVIDDGTITGETLSVILSTLPIKELKSTDAQLAIEGAILVYDLTVGDSIKVTGNAYVLAAATGIRDGMKIALGK